MAKIGERAKKLSAGILRAALNIILITVYYNLYYEYTKR